MEITPRQKFIHALNRQPISGRVPHFELVFYLTMEAFGKVHPCHRLYKQWDQMEKKEQLLHRKDIADIYLQIAQRFEHSAVFLMNNIDSTEEMIRLIELVKEKSGDKYFTMIHGDATLGIPGGEKMLDFVYRLNDEPEKVKSESYELVNKALKKAEQIKKSNCGLDCFTLCTDYGMNAGPFLSPAQFSEFVTPYLQKLIQGYRDLGFYTIKHTDGNIMPVLDQIIACKPHALHSIDPQAGMDIREVKKLYGATTCLIGNVNCAELDTGSEKKVRESTAYALQNGMPGYGYIFSSSNCIYTGMQLSSYEVMLDEWKKTGNY